MPSAPKCCGGPRAHTGDIHTVIFVDVDGVLNVGARDKPGGSPLLLSEKNLERARRLASNGSEDNECVQKLLSIGDRELGPGEEGTYSTLTSSGATAEVSAILVRRLAQIVRAAGPQRTVVLSSTWRRPQHWARVQRLEQQISEHLGESFSFDDRTRNSDDIVAEDRLQCLGEFVGSTQFPSKGKVRVLILEDFFITPVRGWSCGGIAIKSVESVERYLLCCCPSSVSATVKLVHTYDEWETPRGLEVQAGVGLTMHHFSNAMRFLGADPASGLTTPRSTASEEENNSQCVSMAVESMKEIIGPKLGIPSPPSPWASKLALKKRGRVPLPWVAIASLCGC